jgi:type II secretory pathway component PulF
MQWTQSWKFWVPVLGSLALLTIILSQARQREIFFRSWLRAFASVPGWGQYFQAVYHSGSSWQGLLAGLEAVILTGPLSASLGRTLVYARTSSFSAALAAQLRSGSTLSKAIRPAAEASGSLLAQLHHKTILQHLQEGLPLYAALAIPGIFPPLFIQGMKVGEESGKLPEMCQKCSDVLSMEVEHSLESTLALLEPLVVAFLGVVMAFLALLMLGPLVKVVQAL